jgi:predicted ATP-dependent endonuclease of OLD family
MNADNHNFPGARWWKFDLHTHTSASDEYGKGKRQAEIRLHVTPEEWLLGYMRAGIDCVAVTDHNTGEWVDRLKSALDDLKTHSEFRPLALFPGVEISANGGIHVLAVFDVSKSTKDVSALLGACGFRGKYGDTNGVTDKTVIEVVTEIAKAGALPILAHVDETNSGAFVKLTGPTLQRLIESDVLVVMEVLDPVWVKPGLYLQAKKHWAEVIGSDAHHPDGRSGQNYPGSRFTWIKMDIPSLPGLRLALIDGAPMSVLRSDASTEDPTRHAENLIEEIVISKARYCGRPDPLRLRFSPWLNALIGGRGTGKSSVVEFLRLTLRRDRELSGKNKQEFEEFAQIPKTREDQGALEQTTLLQAVYRKGPGRYRLNWNSSGASDDSPAIEEFREGKWIAAQGDIAERFRVRIFSQRQVFAMAEESEALLRVVDESSDVRGGEWIDVWNQENSLYLSLMAKSREISARLAEQPKIQGELDDVLRKLKIFEGAEHAKVLREYQQRQRQRRALSHFDDQLAGIAQRIREAADDIFPSDLDRSLFNQSAEDAGILQHVDETLKALQAVQKEILNQAEAATKLHQRWQSGLQKSAWESASQKADSAYRSLSETLKGSGAGDPSEYSSLVQRRQVFEQKQKGLVDLRSALDDTLNQARESLDRMRTMRRELSASRRLFLNRVLENNPLVRIALQPYGKRPRQAETQIRRLLNCEDERFSSDILAEDEKSGFIADLFKDLPRDADASSQEIEKRLEEIKAELLAASQGKAVPRFGQWFKSYMMKAGPEMLDHLMSWFPEDSLDVSYSQHADGKSFRPIQQGSPGQKTAAILAFLLSYGDEPIILDQPEDDLDNHLIYDLIVRQLRNNKLRRQIIVVTHNPNIVVNGDAEMVFAMDNRNGQCQIIEQGSLLSVRNEICRVMEGGKEAFAMRYRRIGEGGDDV